MRNHVMPCRARMSLGTIRGLAIAISVSSAALFTMPAGAQEVDPHQLYEQRCAACHQPHARDLVKETLTLSEGRAVLKGSKMPLVDFLASHPRKALEKPQADALVKQFEAMLKTGFLFEQKCIVCHERASELARLRLLERNDAVVGRYSGRDIATFMQTHGRLTSPEVDTIMAMLRRQLETSGAD